MHIFVKQIGTQRPRFEKPYTFRDRGGKICLAHCLDEIPIDGRHWLIVLIFLLREFNHYHASKHKNVSFKTMHERKEFLFRFFRSLRDIGYNLDPRSFGNRHVKAAVALWIKENLAASTMQTYLSFLRAFADWIGKPGMILKPEFYVDDPERFRRCYVVKKDKSWDANGVDINELITRISDYDPYAAAWLAMIAAFGLRCREAKMLQPHLAVVPAATAGIENPTAEFYLNATRGAKGGRPRFIPVDSQDKWDAIERAKQLVKKTEGHLGHPNYSTLKASTRHYRYGMEKFGITMKDLGVTPHGLRHQYANKVYADLTKVASPIRGGSTIDPIVDKYARLSIAEELGHGRTQISSAYLGGVLRKRADSEGRSNE